MTYSQGNPRAEATDRQRVLDEVCRRALKGFVGRVVSPSLMAEAEAAVRREIDDAIRAGNYVLPDGLVLDRVALGTDMRIKVVFKTAEGVRMSENTLRVLQKPWCSRLIERDDELTGAKPTGRFEAVALEIADDEEPTG